MARYLQLRFVSLSIERTDCSFSSSRSIEFHLETKRNTTKRKVARILIGISGELWASDKSLRDPRRIEFRHLLGDLVDESLSTAHR